MAGVCPSCNKFASLDEPEVDDSSVSVDGTTISVDVSVYRNTSCCGDEMKRADLNNEFEIDHECTAIADGTEEADFDYDEPEWEPYVSGGGRYAKSYVGVTGTINVTCQVCNEQIAVDVTEGALAVAAGDMESSV